MKFLISLSLFFSVLAGFCLADPVADSELTNYRSGINVLWGGVKGTDYYEEYYYYDKPVNDAKTVYILSTTEIYMEHNDRNGAWYHVADGGYRTIGVNGLDGIANSGDEGIIRYKIDRDRQDYLLWSDNGAQTTTARVLPSYGGPFTLGDQSYGYGDAVPIVGTTGGNGGTITSKSSYYYRGLLDSVGDEWHVLAYADDDNVFQRPQVNYIDQKFYASDARTILLVVNPKTPCFTARVTGTGQFYTTPPKAYWTPKMVDQTTYISPGASGAVSIELRCIQGLNVFYRIGGSGPFTDAGAATVTIPDTAFVDGPNTLYYYYAGNAAYTKTRTVVKNPIHPSLAEPHGNYLFIDSTNYANILSRIARAPYKSTYDGYKSGGDVTGQVVFESNIGTGKKSWGGDPLANAFVAKVNGFAYTAPSRARSFGEYAKRMLLKNSRSNDPVGFEVQMSAGASGNRELHAFGYNDAYPVLKDVFAYDIIAANFRSDQVSGGLTPIEDYFVRDCFANFAFEALQWGAGMQALGEPGMWGGARMMCAVSIGIILREYSTPYYGTSGFGTVQTTYPLCPYQNDEFTWKEALFDTQTRTAYPNLAWNTGLSNNGLNSSLLLADNEVIGSYAYSLGDFNAKTAYTSYGLMGKHLCIWANMVKLWEGGFTDSRLESFIQKITTNTLRGKGESTTKAKQATNLISNGSPGVVTWASHSLAAGTPIIFRGVSLPAEIVQGQTYYVSNTNVTTNSFEVSMSVGGSSLNTSGGSGYQEVSTIPVTTRSHVITLLNERWPSAVANNLSWVQSLPSNDGNSDDKAMQDGGVFGFSWYDDGGGGLSPDMTAPTIAITGPTTSPTLATSLPVIETLSGTATDDTAVSYVTWSNDRGGSGTAAGTNAWNVTPLTLQPGVNVITVRAFDAAGNSSTDVITITFTLPPVGDLTTHTNPRNRRLFGR